MTGRYDDLVAELSDTDDLGSSLTDFEYMIDLMHKAAAAIKELAAAVEDAHRAPL
jgi:hypothetical protein